MDDILEFLCTKDLQRLRPNQFPLPALLHLPPPATIEYQLYILDPHARRFQIVRRYWGPRFAPQRLSGIL